MRIFTSSGAPVRTACLLLLLALAACVAPGARVVIYQKPSMFGTLVVTDDGAGLRSLRFAPTGITQTTIKVGDPDHLHYGYSRLALAAFALVEAPRRVLLVGLGGAALPVFLHRHYPGMQIDVVEIDPEVVTAAKLHFGFREDARMRAHVADGRDFIERAQPGHYDLILLDAFGSSEVPFHLVTEEFLLATRRALAPGGVVASNVWRSAYNRHYADMLRTHQEVFAEVHILEAAREVNHMVFALPRTPAHFPTGALTPERFADQARRVSRDKGFRFELGQMVRDSYTPAPARDAGGQVLRDASR